MPGHIKFLAVLLVIAMTGIISYANSDAIYSFYLRTWYINVKKMKSSDAITHSELMKREFQKAVDSVKKSAEKEYIRADYEAESLEYINTMSRVFSPGIDDRYSPENREFAMYAGMFYLERGNVLKGAGMILAAAGNPPARNEAVPFMRAIRALYDARMFNDVVSELAIHRYPLTGEVLFLRGSSLFNLKEYRDAVQSFHQAMNAGWKGGDIDFEIAMCYNELKLYGEALPYATRALSDNPKDRKGRELVVHLLNVTGKTKEAEKVSRER